MKSKPNKTEIESINNEFIKLYKFSIERYVVKKNTIKPIKETKGSASKAVASTKSEKQEIISEGTDMKARFQKLANIL